VIPPLSPITPLTGGASPVPGDAPAQAGGGFRGLLGQAVDGLQSDLQQSSTAAQQLATGQAKDISAVVSQVERASLAVQLATQIRNKAVDAYQEIFRMQM
jgi:flagellar hook-basal body complex protein FliE